MGGAGVESRPAFYEFNHPQSQLIEKRETLKPHRGLEEEMLYLRSNWKKEGLPQNYVNLPGVGFFINTQVGFLESEAWKGISKEEKLKLWCSMTDYSLRGWILEYLNGGLVFPGRLSIGRIDGELDILDSRHGAARKLSDTISKKERNGKVWNAYIGRVKPFLLTAPNGSIAVVSSPRGESGVRDEQGKMVVYEDSHYDILIKNGSEINEYTLRTDFTHAEDRELMKRLRRYVGQDQQEEGVALFNSNSMPFKIEDIVNVMRDVRFDMTGGSLYVYKRQMWQDVYRDLRKGEELLRYDSEIERYIAEFLEFSKRHEEKKEALAVTILRISQYILDKKERSLPSVSARPSYNTEAAVFGYGNTFKTVKTISGCAGGNSEKSFSSQVNNLIKILFGKVRQDDEEEVEPFNCPDCGFMTQEKVQGEHCPRCNYSKAEFIASGGEAC